MIVLTSIDTPAQEKTVMTRKSLWVREEKKEEGRVKRVVLLCVVMRVLYSKFFYCFFCGFFDQPFLFYIIHFFLLFTSFSLFHPLIFYKTLQERK